MRKRVSRPHRFAAVENNAIDTLPSILAVGLLTRLIRAKDGDDVTVETLATNYAEGEKALSKAMRALVDNAYVVKFKIQRATSETVIDEAGQQAVKRGGSWYTTFTVDSVPFTADDVAVMLEDIYAEGNVKCHRVEPTRLDPAKRATSDGSRPTPPSGDVGATCENVDSGEGQQSEIPEKLGARPTPPRGAPGRPAPGEGGAHIRKKTSYPHAGNEEMDALSARSAGDGRRPSDRSSVREAEGGSAASSTTDPSPTSEVPAARAQTSSSKAKHTRQELDLARKVAAAYPEELGVRLVPVLTDAILNALAGDVPGSERTVDQLGARIVQRWNHHGYAAAFYRGEIERPVGVAVEMVRPLKPGDRYGCANPRCEVGRDVDTGADCPVCPARLADRQRARRNGDDSIPGQRSRGAGELPWECGVSTCRKAVQGPRTVSGLCPGCEADLERDAARFQAEQATIPDGGPAVPVSKPASGPAPEDPAVDEETARLRAHYARQYGSPEQVEAYCGNAPF